MVTRKPVGGQPLAKITTNTAASNGNNVPPYPTSPLQTESAHTASTNSESVYSADLKHSPAFDLIDMHEARQQQRTRSDSDASSHGTWDSDDTEHDELDDMPEEGAEVPKPLQVGGGKMKQEEEGGKQDGLPASLRIGPTQPPPQVDGHGYEDEAQSNPWAAGAGQLESNNPYLKQKSFVGDSSQSAWREVQPPTSPGRAPPPIPSSAPPPPPTEAAELSAIKSPTEDFSEMSLNEHRPASWELAERLNVPQIGQAPLPPVTAKQDRPESTWWQDHEAESQQLSMDAASAPPEPPPKQASEPPQYQPPPGPPPAKAGTLIDHSDAPSTPSRRAPPPITTSQPSASGSNSASIPETPGTKLNNQRNKTYQIKHINWFDASFSQDPRMMTSMRNSPILVQNANGPCPLLALVNALVLSTPQDVDASLVEILRTREQISLGYLLDAVFDELMSGRRGDTASALPDVTDLYAFLLALHTGMNVNPRFVTPVTTPRGSLDGHPDGWGNVHPVHRAQRKAGAFEETREMRLYSTFNIPLIHGWTASADSPAYEAFVRTAPTFEDAQSAQIAEVELLQKPNLTPQETQTLQDIQTIKAFLQTWPTQLTDFGLEAMSASLAPGQIAILFRNDHFSTVYKEPKHGALMTLVTDAGYASHDEIVWESLVDVNGAASEMFSGDFRVVSHGQGGGERGWREVETGNSRQNYHNQHIDGFNGQAPLHVKNGPVTPETPPPPLPARREAPEATPAQTDDQRKAAEQEDHDLALALQLQEEEEDQHRQAEQRRRRELELNEQFLSNEGTSTNSNNNNSNNRDSEGPRPPIPPRRAGGRAGSGPTTAPAARAPVNRPTDTPGDPDAPPSYEQAASDRPYRPAGSTAPATGVQAQGNPLRAYDALRRQQSAYAQQSTSTVNSIPPNQANVPSPPYTQHARRRSEGNRLRRTSQIGVPGAYPGGAGGTYTGTPYAGSHAMPIQQGQRVPGAASAKDADDRCVIM